MWGLRNIVHLMCGVAKTVRVFAEQLCLVVSRGSATWCHISDWEMAKLHQKSLSGYFII